MLWRRNFFELLLIALSSLLLLQMGQVDAARLLQVLPGNAVLHRPGRSLLQTASSLASSSSSTSGSSSILGSSGGLGTSLGATGGDQSGSSSGSLLSAVQSGSINSSPPPGGLIGLQSPPPSSAMPQLNWNPSGNSFNSGTGRRMHAHA